MLKVYYLNDKGMHDFGKAAAPQRPRLLRPREGVGLGYHVNELQRPLNS
jgi:hypothetical protein